MTTVPQAVVQAIAQFVPSSKWEISPPKSSETSFIFNWGVRLVPIGVVEVSPLWVCQADETCRKRSYAVTLCTGKTSKATKHLFDAHGISSTKSRKESTDKRGRDEALARLQRTPLYRDDSSRAYLLLETQRMINNQLAFHLDELDESLAIRDLVVKETMRLEITAELVQHTIVELYKTTKTELENLLTVNKIGSARCFCIVTDVRPSKVKSVKVLGLRLSFVDVSFRFQSVLLGTHRLMLGIGSHGGSIQAACHRWISDVLNDFGITPQNIYGTTSVRGSDVEWMKRSGLAPASEPCVAHWTNEAALIACGMLPDSTGLSKNPTMTALIRRIIQCVCDTKYVKDLSPLFVELSDARSTRNARGASPDQLLAIRTDRLVVLTRLIRRVLQLWDLLERWYQERRDKAISESVPPPPSFPVARDKTDLVQILSLLEPITLLNKISQGQQRNHTEVFMELCKLRISLLDTTVPLKDYRSSGQREFFSPDQLSMLTTHTRALLAESFHLRFFRRYTDPEVMRTCSYVFEMQLLLHPVFKNLDGGLKRVVMLCNLQAGASQQVAEQRYENVRELVFDGVRQIMASVDTPLSQPITTPPPPPAVMSDNVVELFSGAADQAATPRIDPQLQAQRDQHNGELGRWLASPTSLSTSNNTPSESVLSFWKHQECLGSFRNLPNVARVLYAMSVSSTHLDQDLAVADSMALPQRRSVPSHTTDMAAFLNCNRDFVDITQCAKIPTALASKSVPTHMLASVERGADTEVSELLSFFTSTSTSANSK